MAALVRVGRRSLGEEDYRRLRAMIERVEEASLP
jgi:hypothetical protein